MSGSWGEQKGLTHRPFMQLSPRLRFSVTFHSKQGLNTNSVVFTHKCTIFPAPVHPSGVSCILNLQESREGKISPEALTFLPPHPSYTRWGQTHVKNPSIREDRHDSAIKHVVMSVRTNFSWSCAMGAISGSLEASKRIFTLSSRDLCRYISHVSMLTWFILTLSRCWIGRNPI